MSGPHAYHRAVAFFVITSRPGSELKRIVAGALEERGFVLCVDRAIDGSVVSMNVRHHEHGAVLETASFGTPEGPLYGALAASARALAGEEGVATLVDAGADDSRAVDFHRAAEDAVSLPAPPKRRRNDEEPDLTAGRWHVGELAGTRLGVCSRTELLQARLPARSRLDALLDAVRAGADVERCEVQGRSAFRVRVGASARVIVPSDTEAADLARLRAFFAAH